MSDDRLCSGSAQPGGSAWAHARPLAARKCRGSAELRLLHCFQQLDRIYCAPRKRVCSFPQLEGKTRLKISCTVFRENCSDRDLTRASGRKRHSQNFYLAWRVSRPDYQKRFASCLLMQASGS
jgi:hypothetical protein